MKTAVSLPNEIFSAPERHAKLFGIPRSKLYAIALSEYLQKERFSGVKEAFRPQIWLSAIQGRSYIGCYAECFHRKGGLRLVRSESQRLKAVLLPG
jgi:hypothetical protein